MGALTAVSFLRLVSRGSILPVLLFCTTLDWFFGVYPFGALAVQPRARPKKAPHKSAFRNADN